MNIILRIIIFSLMANSAMAEVYSWKDDKGQIVFGDNPPKNKTSTAVSIENTDKSGAQFADPGQIKSLEQESAQPRHTIPPPVKRIDSHCRDYISQLNKVEIYLEHTNSTRDEQKALDLRKLIKSNCDDVALNQKFSDSYCRRYREDLTRTEIFLEHTNSRRDQNKADDLRKQISRECQ